jgi:DNA-binding response OmpR family regulator
VSYECKSVRPHGRRVLIVEDDDRLYCGLKDALTDSGYEPIGTTILVSEALRTFADGRIDVALIDVDHHSETVRALVRNLRARGIPILLIGTPRPGSLLNARTSMAVLMKPFDSMDLLDSVRECLEKRPFHRA